VSPFYLPAYFLQRRAQYPVPSPGGWPDAAPPDIAAWRVGPSRSRWRLPDCLMPTPLGEITALSVADDGTLAIGGPDGAAILEQGRWHYFGGRRWLPVDEVRRLRCVSAGELIADTPAGVARIATLPMSLAEKAAEYERQIDARHNRNGYDTVCCLDDPDDLASYRHEVSDNDGLWTALYVAAESFRYAATGEEEARQRAARSMRALLELERITGIPGFPARALAEKDEPRAVLSRGEWHEADDDCRLWKGDTSSDEIVGHYFAYHVYFNLVADESEEPVIRETVRRITDHILEHRFRLVDRDGVHTRWGVWSPELLHSPRWAGDRGLNSLEILSHLLVANQIVGDPRYAAAADTLVNEHGYALNTVQQKITTPGHVNHSDDELAFLSYYPLLIGELDAHRRALYQASLERSWQIERPERCPLWNIIYGALSLDHLTGEACDLEAAVRTLVEIPLDLRHWGVRNSHRPDVVLDAEAGRFGEKQSRRGLPAGERPMMKWNGNPYRLDGGDGGRTEEDGTFFLLPYWMGRYHRLLRESEDEQRLSEPRARRD
jgi:hypothetical protein